MSKDEKDAFLDELDDFQFENNKELLKEARTAYGDTLRVACAILTTPDGKKHIAHSVIDYEDDDGIRMISDFVKEVHDQNILEKGETIKLAVYNISLTDAMKISNNNLN